MIEPNTPITIMEVGNGYIVEPMPMLHEPCVVSKSDQETLVFADLNSLGLWLREHFNAKETP